jgi:phosphate transport system substrate-binding protein
MNKDLIIAIKVILSVIFAFIFFAAAFLLSLEWFGFFPNKVEQLYSKAILLCSIIMLFIVYSFMWKWFKLKTRLIVIGAVILSAFLYIGTERMNMAYHANIPELSERLDLSLYAPYREGSKVVSLNEPSTLILTGDLPRMNGSSMLYPMYAAFAQAVYPEGSAAIEIYENQQSPLDATAYTWMVRGRADIIFVDAEPSESALKEADAKGVEFNMTPIGCEALVFFVNIKNPVNSLTISDIQDIYSGKVTKWRNYGGKTQEIRSFRSISYGSYTMMKKVMGDIEQIAPGTYRNYKNSIGHSSYYYTQEMLQNGQIKLLSINGVFPTRETIADGSYPLSYDFYAVTEGPPDQNEQELIDWILSEQGEYLIEKSGFIPIKR